MQAEIIVYPETPDFTGLHGVTFQKSIFIVFSLSLQKEILRAPWRPTSSLLSPRSSVLP